MSVAAPPVRMHHPNAAPSAQPMSAPTPPAAFPSSAAGVSHIRRKPSPLPPGSSSPEAHAPRAHASRPPLSTSAAYNSRTRSTSDFAPTHRAASTIGSYSTDCSHVPSLSGLAAAPGTDPAHAAAAAAAADADPDAEPQPRRGVFHRRFNASTDNISMSSRLSISSTVSSASVMIRRGAHSLGAGVTRSRNKISRASKNSIMGISNIFSKDKDKKKDQPATSAASPARAPPFQPSVPRAAPPQHTHPSGEASRAHGAGVAISHMTIESDAAAATREGLTPAAFYVRQMQEAEQARLQQQQQTSPSGSDHKHELSPREAMIEREKERLRAQRGLDQGMPPATASGPTFDRANQLAVMQGAGPQRSSSMRSTRSSKETSDALLQHAADLQADAAPSAALAREERRSEERDDRTASSFYDVSSSSWAPGLPPLDLPEDSLLSPDLEILSSQQNQPDPQSSFLPPTHRSGGSVGSVVSVGSLGTDSSAPQETDSLRQWAEGIERGRISAARAPTPRSILKKREEDSSSTPTPEGPSQPSSIVSNTQSLSAFPLNVGPTSPPPGAAPSPAPSAPSSAPARAPSSSAGGKRIVFASRAQMHSTWPAHVYDRRGELTTANRLTPVLAQQIKEELNAYKMEEMPVAPSSRMFTQFFV